MPYGLSYIRLTGAGCRMRVALITAIRASEQSIPFYITNTPGFTDGEGAVPQIYRQTSIETLRYSSVV